MKQKYKYSVREVIIEYFNYKKYGISASDAVRMLQEKIEVEWKPKNADPYNYINSYGDISGAYNTGSDIDRWRIKTGNCFPYTEEGKKQCEEYKQKLISLGGTK